MKSQFKNFFFTLLVFRGIEFCKTVNAVLDFKLIGEGFHRTFEYRISIDGLKKESACALAVHVSLPAAIYVNVDEIADLERIGKTLACSEGEIDVELFTEKASPQNVTICEELKPFGNVLSLPTHQRYKFSKENGSHVAVDIPRPKLLLGCEERLKDHRVSKIDLCSPCVDLAIKWREIQYEMESVDKVWLIPVGDVSELTQVSVITLLVTCVGAAVVLRALLGLRISGDEENEEEEVRKGS